MTHKFVLALAIASLLACVGAAADPSGMPAMPPDIQRIMQKLQSGQPTSISLERPGQNGKEVVEVKVAVVKQPGAKPDDATADWGAALKALADELTATLKNPATKNPELSIDADRPLRYGYVIAIREVAEASGFKKIGFNAPR